MYVLCIKKLFENSYIMDAIFVGFDDIIISLS
jgi:hypothetical protein